jgi:hypothetical protein
MLDTGYWMLDEKQTDLRPNWNLVSRIQHLESNEKPSPQRRKGFAVCDGDARG